MASILEMLKEYCQAWNTHDAEKIASLYTEDGVLQDEPAGVVANGRDAVRKYAQGMFSAFPDIKMEATNLFESKNVGASEMVMTATNKGPLRDGTPPTGKNVSMKFCAIYECEGALVRHSRNYYDRASLTRQLGLMPPIPK